MSTGRPVTFTNWNAGEPVRANIFIKIKCVYNVTIASSSSTRLSLVVFPFFFYRLETNFRVSITELESRQSTLLIACASVLFLLFFFKLSNCHLTKMNGHFPFVVCLLIFLVFGNRTISDTRTERRNIVWSCGIVTARDWSGTTVRARLKLTLFVKRHFKRINFRSKIITD